MKLMTAMPIEIKLDLVAGSGLASDSHCKIIGFPIGRDLEPNPLTTFTSSIGTKFVCVSIQNDDFSPSA